jgi:hypothetical protein
VDDGPSEAGLGGPRAEDVGDGQLHREADEVVGERRTLVGRTDAPPDHQREPGGGGDPDGGDDGDDHVSCLVVQGCGPVHDRPASHAKVATPSWDPVWSLHRPIDQTGQFLLVRAGQS